MSVDRSLKSRSMLERHRNVLSRAERLEKLTDQECWTEEQNSVFGLPKVAHRKSAAGKKAKKEAAEGAAAEGAAPAAAPAAPSK